MDAVLNGAMDDGLGAGNCGGNWPKNVAFPTLSINTSEEVGVGHVRLKMLAENNCHKPEGEVTVPDQPGPVPLKTTSNELHESEIQSTDRFAACSPPTVKSSPRNASAQPGPGIEFFAKDRLFTGLLTKRGTCQDRCHNPTSIRRIT